MYITPIRNLDDVRRNLQRLGSTIFGPKASPTYVGLTLTGLTASQLLQTDANKKLTSIALPLIVEKGGTGAATLTDHSILLGSGTGAVTALGAATNGQLPIGSTGADPVLAVLTGTANQITVTNGAGSITLSLPQNIHTGASPTFVDVTATGDLKAGIDDNTAGNLILYGSGSGADGGCAKWYTGADHDTSIEYYSWNIDEDDFTLKSGVTNKLTLAGDTGAFSFTGGVNINGIVKLGDGGTTNYTEVETDGTLEFHGTATVWNDANVGAMTLTVPVASQPDEANFIDEAAGDTGITTWAYAIGEKSSGAIEVPHDYKEGSDVTFHVHWQGIAAPSGTDYVKWQLTYTIAAANGEETLDAATTITVETAFDTQYEFKLSSFAAITGTNIQIGDQFLFTLERVAAAGDAYAGDALIATIGLHYECDTVGSRQMLTKA